GGAEGGRRRRIRAGEEPDERRALMAGKLEGRGALVTGASRGFGRAIALAFAREGARVAVNYLASQRQADEAVAEAKGLGAEAFAIRGDVASEPEARAVIGAAGGGFGGLGPLVDKAGCMGRGAALPAKSH